MQKTQEFGRYCVAVTILGQI